MRLSIPQRMIATIRFEEVLSPSVAPVRWFCGLIPTRPARTDASVHRLRHAAATGTITVNGGVNAGDTATVGIEDRLYNYVVTTADTLDSIRDALIGLINANPEEKVTASAAAAMAPNARRRVTCSKTRPGP